MKLCIPVASAEGLGAPLHPDFGAARHLLIVEDDSVHAVDREHPELISEAIVSGIDAILCSEIHPRLLYELQHSGVQVYGCEAGTASEALAQFRAGELEAAPPFDPRGEGAAHGCGGHGHGDHECCGGKGHEDADHECCGGKGHEQGGGGCGGHGHGHGGCGCGH